MAQLYKISLSNIQLNHPTALLQSLNELRKSRILTDVTIVVEGEHHHAHKAVLVAGSEYFRAMFSVNMKENREKMINLDGVQKDGFEVILEFLYTAKLELTEENVEPVLSTANYLQMDHILETCNLYLESIMSVKNCFDIYLMAEYYHLTALKDIALGFICRNFQAISSTKDFLEIDFNTLKAILQSDHVTDTLEKDILRAVLKWITEATIEKERHVPDDHRSLLSCIRYSEVTLPIIMELFESIYPENASTDNLICKMIIDMKSKQQTTIPQKSDLNEFNTRGMKKTIITIGGFTPLGVSNDLTFYQEDRKKWKLLSIIPYVKQCNYGTIVIKNELYIAGGCYNQGLVEILHNYVYKYNPQKDKWIKLASLLKDRCRFSLSALGNYVYAIGGEVELDFGNEQTDSVERYNIEKDIWEVSPPLPECRTQHASVSSVGNENQRLYVSGGLNKDQVRSKVYCFDPNSRLWSVVTKMLTPRADHTMVCYQNKLFFAGGWKNESDTRIPVGDIEVYDIEHSIWSVVNTIESPRIHSALVADDEKLWIVGGLVRHHNFSKKTAATLCYDLKTNRWHPELADGLTVWEHSCAVLYVPKCKMPIKL